MEKRKPVLLSCEHMRLRVTQDEIQNYKSYLQEINTPDENTFEEISELKKELLRLDSGLFEQEIYAPWCSKLNHLCLPVAESVIIDNGYMPLSFILKNSKRILNCEQAKLSKASFLEDFILNKIDVDYL